MLALFYVTIAVAVIGTVNMLRRHHLSHEEKLAGLVGATLSLPIGKLLVSTFLYSAHQGLYDAAGGDPSRFDVGDGSTFALLSWAAGFALPLAILAYCDWLNNTRAADKARTWELAQVEKQRLAAIEHKREKKLLKQRKLDTRLAIRQVEYNGMQLAAVRSQQIVHQRSADEMLILAFGDFRLRVDPHRERTEQSLQEEFRAEIARRRIPKLDFRDLATSNNPQVQAIMGAVARPALEP